MGLRLRTTSNDRNDGSFDRVARFYDYLARIVFGDELLKAEQFLHTAVRPGDRVLLIGGGTGRGLESLLSRLPREIVFVDASAEMLTRAYRRFPHNERIYWRHGTDRDVSTLGKFDVIITPFFLDVFPPDRLTEVMERLDLALAEGGRWLVAEFSLENRSGSWWKIPLVEIMFLFFRITVGLKSRHLPDWTRMFESRGFRLIEAKARFNGLIRSMVWTKDQRPEGKTPEEVVPR